MSFFFWHTLYNADDLFIVTHNSPKIQHLLAECHTVCY